MIDERHIHELEHGRYLAAEAAEEIWGWGTPAGQLRAKRRAELILRGAEIGTGSRVLEIGCGTGLFTEMFTMAGAHITAIDISPDLLNLARARRLPRVKFLARSFEDWDIDEAFDAVIGSSVLHHLDLELALPQMLRLLKPGGRMSFAEPNMLNPQIYCERRFRHFFPQVSPDETAFVRIQLRKTLEAVGFGSVSIQPFDWLHPATPPFLIKTVSNLGGVFEKLWPIKEFAGSLHICASAP